MRSGASNSRWGREDLSSRCTGRCRASTAAAVRDTSAHHQPRYHGYRRSAWPAPVCEPGESVPRAADRAVHRAIRGRCGGHLQAQEQATALRSLPLGQALREGDEQRWHAGAAPAHAARIQRGGHQPWWRGTRGHRLSREGQRPGAHRGFTCATISSAMPSQTAWPTTSCAAGTPTRRLS